MADKKKIDMAEYSEYLKTLLTPIQLSKELERLLGRDDINIRTINYYRKKGLPVASTILGRPRFCLVKVLEWFKKRDELKNSSNKKEIS